MTSTNKIRHINGISEAQYLSINNTRQYVLIRGEFQREINLLL